VFKVIPPSTNAANYTPMNSYEVPTDSARQESVEFRDDANDFIVQHHNRWHNRLKFPPSEIGERYCRGDLGVVLQFSLEGVLENRVFYSALVVRSIFPDHEVSDVCGECKAGSAEAHNELFVLIDDVHIVDERQEAVRRVGGVIRLKPSNETYNPRIGNSLYFSFESFNAVFVDWPGLENGKLDPYGAFFPVTGVRKNPYDVVEYGAKMVDNLASENAKAERNRSTLMILHGLQKQLRVVLWNDGISAFLKEPIDLGLKIKDVLVGPF
jgi:hypothetical protein